MKPTQNHKPKQVKAFSFKTTVLISLMALNTFGHKALSFFDKLFTVSDGPFAGLNKGQLKKMSWLYCMYR
jgi:hypothetical protein